MIHRYTVKREAGEATSKGGGCPTARPASAAGPNAAIHIGSR
jgi:hypothetical protein